MEFKEPEQTGVCVYSKSNCKFCDMVKELLTKRGFQFVVIDCDEYLVSHREEFKNFIDLHASGDTAGFPKVFNNGFFIGSYNATKDFLDMILFAEEDADG
jgi:glutaredoxin